MFFLGEAPGTRLRSRHLRPATRRPGAHRWPRLAALGALAGIVEGWRRKHQPATHHPPASVLAVEQFTGKAPGFHYAQLGFHPPRLRQPA